MGDDGEGAESSVCEVSSGWLLQLPGSVGEGEGGKHGGDEGLLMQQLLWDSDIPHEELVDDDPKIDG